MNKTLKTQLNKLTLEQLFIIAQELDRTFWAYEDLKDFAIDKIKDDYIFVALHILNALNDTLADYYKCDSIRGAFDTVAPITTKDEFIDYLENYDDENIKKVLKNIKGDL